MTTHDLKTWPAPFFAVLDGTKTHEIRVADRPFAVGDVLHLREWVPLPNGGREAYYTGRSVDVEVTYLSSGGSWGLPDNLCVMSIRLLLGQRPGERVAPEERRCWRTLDERAVVHAEMAARGWHPVAEYGGGPGDTVEIFVPAEAVRGVAGRWWITAEEQLR